jgi:hypothetical protein
MPAFAPEDFWMKARLFVNRATEPDDHRSEDERRLWASLALELLAKWALAQTAPVLVADPQNGGGEQMYKALGLKEGGGAHVTVTASTAFKRCAALYRPFNDTDALRFSEARNEYLHGFEIALMRLPDDAWWSRYWSLVNVLLAAHAREPRDLVGDLNALDIERHLERNAKWIEQRAEAAIAGARRNLKRYRDGLMSAPEAAKWAAVKDLSAILKYSAKAMCPACGGMGDAEAENETKVEPYYPDEPDGYVMSEVYFEAEFFSCPTCHLVLDTWEMAQAAGVTDEFSEVTDEPHYEESEYGND